jgi:predicted phosphodiesterase
MKKTLSLILCLCMLLSMGAMAVSAADEELVVNIATDIHFDQDSMKTSIPKRNNISEDFAHAADQGKLYSESKAIIASFLEKSAADNCQAVLIPGDLADSGNEKEMAAVADMFAAFEKETGKQIYVVPGNHDVSRTDVSLFLSHFSAFGYDEAIARDQNSASYVAELDDNYRLLAIDSTLAISGACGIDAKRAEWIRQQCEAAQNEGKKMMAMMHHNLLPHLVLIDVLHQGSLVPDSVGLKEIFAKYGVKYIFTGHTHESDIASYTGANGEVIYDVVTGSMNVYPCPYRTVTFGDEVKFELKSVDVIDDALVPAKGMSAVARELMNSDFTAYAKECVDIGFAVTINSIASSPSYVKNLLKIDSETNPEMSAIIDKLVPALSEGINMPFYAKDETTEGMSIESILKAYDVTIPASKYKNVCELGVAIYLDHTEGDENFQAYNNEVVLASKGIGAVLIYALKDVSAEEYTQALSYVCKLLKVDVPADLISYAGNTIDRFEGIELVISTAILPLILEVTVDDAPGDCNVTLPGYGDLIETETENLTFWQKVEAFFIKVFSFFMSIFAFI